MLKEEAGLRSPPPPQLPPPPPPAVPFDHFLLVLVIDHVLPHCQ